MQTWNKTTVVKGILDRKDKGLSLASRSVVATNTPLIGAARRYFGGWAQAVKAANINYDNIKSKNQSRIFWDRDKIVNAILSLEAKQASLRLTDVKKTQRKLVKAAIKWFGNWANAVKAAGFDYEEMKLSSRNYKWSKDKVLQEILKRYNANQTLSSAHKEVELQRLVNAALRHFGSWKKAIETSGIDYNKLVIERLPDPKWNKDKIIEVILDRHALELPLSSFYVEKHYSGIHCAARKLFGSWKKAIEASGIDYQIDVRVKEAAKAGKSISEKGRTIYKWGKENIIKAIQKRFELDLPLNSNFVVQNALALHGAARKYFGSWEEAIEAAGFSYSDIRLVKRSRAWDKESIVAYIKERHQEGLPLNGQAIVLENQMLYKAAHRFFGRHGWSNALLAAGINPKDINPNRKWTKRKILGRIRKLHREGKPLYAYALKKTEGQSFTAGASSYFGSWRKAIEAAGLKWSNVRGQKKYKWWTKNRVIYRIKYLEKRGVILSSKFMHDNHGDLHSTARNLFGSWSEAVYAAGIDYLAHSKTWSTKAWLRQLTVQEVRGLKTQSIKHAKTGGKNVRNTKR